MKRLLSSITVWMLACVVMHMSAIAQNPPSKTLNILESMYFPIPEISGMCWRINPHTNQKELLMISDNEHKAYFLDWENRNQRSLRSVDLGFTSSYSDSKQSGWESVSSDGSGRVFILQESPPLVLVISSDLKRVEKVIHLKISPKFSEEIGWEASSNSQGEGILLMKNGHFLVVKEKHPLRLVEFAPNNEKAAGYEPQLGIEGMGAFPLTLNKEEEVYSSKFFWQLNDAVETWFKDSSGINMSSNGVLYLLSDESRMIVRIGKELSLRSHQIPLTESWQLPKQIKKPEGMVLDEKNHPIIATDSKKRKKKKDFHNFYVLSAISE